MRVLYLDSDEVYLRGVACLAPKDWDVRCVLHSAEARGDVACDQCDVRVVGFSRTGDLEALESIVWGGWSDRPLLALLSHDLADWLPELSGRGFTGFMLRPPRANALFAAILRIAAGQPYVDPELTGWLHRDADGVWGHFGLSEQQKRVVRSYVERGTRRMVAEELCISENTVKYHLSAAYRKTGTSSLDGLRGLLARERAARFAAAGL
jgi:DNA-binding NarL/FixJ family response regulator